MSTLYVGDSKIDDSDKVNKSGDTMSGTLKAASFVKDGGTSTQFLKADGSVDSSVFLQSKYLGYNSSDKSFYVVLSESLNGDKVSRTSFFGWVYISRGSAVEAMTSIVVQVMFSSAYTEVFSTYSTIANTHRWGASAPISKRRIKYNNKYYQALYFEGPIHNSTVRVIGYPEGMWPFLIPDASAVTEYSDIS